MLDPPRDEEDKKKKKKKKKRKRRPSNFFFFCGLAVFCVSAYLYFSPTLPTAASSSSSSTSKPRLISKKGVNTTSVPWEKDNDDDISNVATLLERYLKRWPGKYHVLCMHHFERGPSPIRACSLRTPSGLIYFLLNPVIMKLYGNEITVNEESQSCTSWINGVKRRTCVNVSWVDDSQNYLQGSFCGDAAVNLQLVIDEFYGSKHCK